LLPKERVIKTLRHEEPDLVPWGEHSIDYNVFEQILGRKTFFQAKFRETKAYWDGRRDEVVASYKRDLIDLVDALGMDIIPARLVPRAGYREKPMQQVDEETYRDDHGSLYRISATTHDLMPYKMNPAAYHPPTLDKIKHDIAELDRNGVPPPEESQLELLRHVVKERGATHFIMLFWSDFGWPSFGQTDEEFYLNLALHPEMHEAIAELDGKYAVASVRNLEGLQIDGVITCGDMGSSTGPLASPQIYRRRVKPWHKAYVQELHELGLYVIKHCCGHVWDFLEDFIDIGYDAYEGIQASGGMDMKLLKERVGDRLTLWGGVWNEHLILGAPDDIRADARYAIKWGAPGGGFIYGASHSLAVGTKPENLMAMKQSRQKWGTYPISI